MDSLEFQRRDAKAHELVEKARLFFRENPLQIVTPDETLDGLLLGMKFQVTNLNYVTNTVTFKLVE